MPRKKFIPTSDFPYHVTNRSNNKECFEAPLPEVWDIFSDQLLDSGERYSVHVHNFVLMCNHFHMVVSTPLGNLDRFLRHFLTETVRGLKKSTHRINHHFGGRSNQTLLDSARSLAYVYKYVYRNPARAGLCRAVEEYPFSTLSRLLAGRCDIPIVDGIGNLWSLIPQSPEERIEWLNVRTPKEEEELIGRALKHSRFKFSSNNGERKKLEALARSYRLPLSDDPYLLGPKGE